jgi:hypothetical protein
MTDSLYPTLGPLAIDWIETYLVHGPGDVQGQPIVLDEEFQAFIYRCYEMYPKGHPQSGRRVYRRAVLSRPKGRAKSELAGMLAMFEALGPCRFNGWDANGDPVGVDGEYSGLEVQAAVVRCFATAEDQAGNTYDNALYMAENGSVADEYEVDAGLGRINFPETGGYILSTSSAPGSKDGGKDTFDVFDETHLWTLPRLKQLHSTVIRNLLKRRKADGWAFETTTMYAIGEGSVAEETHTAIKASPLAGVLFDHKQVPMDVDIDDDDAVYAGLQYVYGPFAKVMDLHGIIQEEFRNPTKRESEVRRYWFNQPWSLEEKFILPDEWDACKSDIVIPARHFAVLALDGSFNNDSTALLAAAEIGDRMVLELVGLWEKPEMAPEGWRVPRLDVMNAIHEARKHYAVAELTADPYGWSQTLEELDEGGLTVTEFPQNGPRMITATKRLYDYIVEGELAHNGDRRLRRHMLNAKMKVDSRGQRLSKTSSDAKIDAAVAGAMAVDTAAGRGAPNIWSLSEAVERLQKAHKEQTAPDGDDGEQKYSEQGIPIAKTTFTSFNQ